MAVRSGNKHTVATRPGTVLPRNRALGPRSVGIVWELLGPDVETRALNIQAEPFESPQLSVWMDSGMLVSGAFERAGDSCLSIPRALQFENDVAARVSGQLLIEHDAALLISGALVADYDAAMAVANAFQRLADGRITVSGFFQREIDTVLTVRVLRAAEVDALLEITDAGLANADVVVTVVRPIYLPTDTDLFVLRRLAPDIETAQVVYAVPLKESHPIQV